ncbi:MULTISPECIES: glycosyltransferase family 2 protein [Rahnella]|jgi:rhamnosyltransferase|uniref:Glycosyltransferase family 2 protein n=1 Tax=Rahnella sp. (strain Y9602) TaxID=2703885 RepID=A0ABW6CA92_RAHSY|nr:MULTISPECIES: glycosyltransferase family 2 protein [Rahnella]AYA06630.1 rhamnosyltransferase [Rahnella aquatilis]AZP50686.1 glycosyltransferase family 2 protein [Rahnella aquatilis]MBU9864189.1 glycosyltransferase family 2 protein [Rahnella aceris]MDP9704144.1 rhamnosyltransferase [Rahnella aquatilis]NIA87425.1 glycosyltransferase family 2 protein [Rahnella aceris]
MLCEKIKPAAVIVSYQPIINDLMHLIDSLKRQGVESIVVDNGSLGREKFANLREICVFIELEKNLGIAAAQNIGIRKAEEKGAEYIVFFDQDSKIDENYIRALTQDFLRVRQYDSKIATIGPVFTDSRHGFYYKVIDINRFGLRKKINPENYSAPFATSLIISSGSMIPIDAIRQIGYMNESLFIDYVDTEWCLRATSQGYTIYVGTSARMTHSIGDKIVRFFMFNIPVHSPFRRYYRVRNAFFLLRMKHVPKLMVVREFIFNFIHQVILILTQKSKKREYLHSFLRAIKDGFLNRRH